MTYPQLSGSLLSGWILNFMREHADSGFTGNTLQGAILRAGYAAPSIQEVDAALEGLFSQGHIIRPFGKSTYPGGTLYQFNPNVGIVHYQERPPEQTLGVQFIKALTEHTINDITLDQMNRIVRRLNRMSQSDRDAPKRVAEVLYDELGADKALQYIERAFANGTIPATKYYALRGFIVFPKPREVTVRPAAGIGSQQLIAGQKRIQQDLAKVRELGIEAVETPMRNLNKDIARLRRSWGI